MLREDALEGVDMSKVDVFSLGILVYELMRSKAQFIEDEALPTNAKEWNAIRFQSEAFLNDYGQCNYSSELKRIVSQCLSLTPSERPSSKDLLEKAQRLAKIERLMNRRFDFRNLERINNMSTNPSKWILCKNKVKDTLKFFRFFD